ncbi:tyrosine--tRNA ligase [Chloroflexia bacterium SDU3-3]|nr:tyrosine--tRNA ligase [Chloroflexia bacterium SDU3-3]
MADIYDELLSRGVAEVLVASELRAKLQSGKKLRLKQGFDPTKPDMHIGHAVGLRKLRKFQELGHQVVLVVGDWTAQIGDPSGRDETRPRLTAEVVQENARTYMKQFFKVVDESQTEVRWQSEWYGKFKLINALDLAGRFTLAQMLAHETFRKRYEEGARLSILELMYPMLQGYDSVAINADVEFGGTDQKFNNLAGRELQGQMGQTPQDILLVPLIPGTDGRKMGKTFNNTIDVLMPPFEMYSKVLSMTDDVMPLYYEVLTDEPLADIAQMKQAMAAGTANPMDFKMKLARLVVDQFHAIGEGAQAEAEWIKRFREREMPTDIPSFAISAPIAIIDLMLAASMAASKSEARRLIDGGGVRLGGEKVEGYDVAVSPDKAPVVLQVGRRKFVQIVAQ